MRLRALLDTDSLGLRLLAGQDQLERRVRGVMTTDLRDPSRYLAGGELVLTGLSWRRDAADSEPFVRLLAAAGVAGLAAGEAELGAVPEDLTAACRRHRLPLFAVDEAVSFARITEHVVRQVSGERAGDLAAVVDRHRRLMAAGGPGGGPRAVLELLGSDLDLRAWLLTATGRRLAGSPGAGLPAATARRLAARRLAAARTGRPGPYRVTLGGEPYALFPVPSGTADGGPDAGAAAPDGGAPGGAEGGGGADGADRPEPGPAALADWVLVVAEDVAEWPAQRLGLLDGVTRLIAAERLAADAARAVPRRLAGEVLELLRGGAPAAEAAARLRLVVPPGDGAEPCWQVVTARLGTGPADAAARDAPARDAAAPDGGGGRRRGRIARAVLEELLAEPPAGAPPAPSGGTAGGTSGAAAPGAPGAVPGPAGRMAAVAAAADGEAVALVACAAGPDGRPLRPLRAGDLLAAVRPVLAAGLEPDGRFTLGVSAAVPAAEGLRGALEEARHCRRVAAARPGPVCGADHEELASHVLLLPFVPDDVRRAFTARLLDPLRAYDRRHRAELLPTLEAFLAADGSWTRCAARLHLHVNTLRYRIGRIEDLTGRDLARLADRLDFLLALRMA